MMKTYAVIGLGRFGAAVALELSRLGKEVLAVDRDPELVQQVADHVTQAVVADAQDEAVLKSLGLRNVDCVVVAIGCDVAASILITMFCKEMGIGRVVCKAGCEEHKRALLKVGADRVVIPEKEMGVKLAQNLASRNVMDYIELSEAYSIMELSTPALWQGKSLRELNIRAKYDISVIAMRRGTKVIVSPGAEEVVQEADILVALGGVDALAALSEQ